jgi:DNA-binding transcriptional LysR family regulator
VDLLSAFRTFIRISETGSFSAVAREVGATQPAISRQVAQLEEHLGARLFQRSTRSLALTEDGRDLLTHARHIVDAVEETESAIGRRSASPSGLVRLGAPSVFGRLYLAPRIGLLMTRYPGLSVELNVADEVVDMVQEGLDLAIRVGEIADASLVARRIGSTTPSTFASVEYLDQHGEPEHPNELADHDCILFTRLPDAGTWVFTGREGQVSVEVKGRFRTNAVDTMQAAVLAGLGIARLPSWMVRMELEAGLVRPILREWKPKPRPIFAVYPSRRFLAPRTRAVIDFLVDEFRLDPVISAYGEVAVP